MKSYLVLPCFGRKKNKRKNSTNNKWWCWRRIRHSPFWMIPTCWCMILVVSLLTLVGFILQIPSIFLGWLAQRLLVPNILVEFLYPSTIAKYGHLLLIRLQQSKTSTKAGESSYRTRVWDCIHEHSNNG